MSRVFDYYNERNEIDMDEPTRLDYLSVSVTGESDVTGTVEFSFDGILTEDEAMNLQEEYGYHPAGYGFSNFNVTQISTLEGDVVTTWECQRSCD